MPEISEKYLVAWLKQETDAWAALRDRLKEILRKLREANNGNVPAPGQRPQNPQGPDIYNVPWAPIVFDFNNWLSDQGRFGDTGIYKP